jgi:hypothetical protein
LLTFGVHLKGGEKGLEQSRELIYGPSEHTWIQKDPITSTGRL